uniref:hypothetical protein n=1 Tax=uncultured Bilophila sp. TaxID=529385 RepID=UPI0025DACDE1|nr:hypothetical protein [uncultured Bilophila sp.]
MTELERMLKESLEHTEQLLRDSQASHAQTLQQHNRELEQIKKEIQTLQTKQHTMTAHLARLNAVYESLQPLLVRLNALLPGK